MSTSPDRVQHHGRREFLKLTAAAAVGAGLYAQKDRLIPRIPRIPIDVSISIKQPDGQTAKKEPTPQPPQAAAPKPTELAKAIAQATATSKPALPSTPLSPSSVSEAPKPLPAPIAKPADATPIPILRSDPERDNIMKYRDDRDFYLQMAYPADILEPADDSTTYRAATHLVLRPSSPYGGLTANPSAYRYSSMFSQFNSTMFSFLDLTNVAEAHSPDYYKKRAQKDADETNDAVKNSWPRQDKLPGYSPATVSDKDGIVISGMKTVILRMKTVNDYNGEVSDWTKIVTDLVHLGNPVNQQRLYFIDLQSHPAETGKYLGLIRSILTDPQFQFLHQVK